MPAQPAAPQAGWSRRSNDPDGAASCAGSSAASAAPRRRPGLAVKPGRRGTVLALGTAQTLAWASSFYLPAVLAAPMARGLGLATSTVYAAFSVALGVSGLVGPLAGRRIDRAGGRGLLVLTSLAFALGLAALGAAVGPWTLVLAWLVIGVAMGAGLYEAAFATLVRLYGSASRDAITGVTLIAGFASTVGWPLSAWMNEAWGWRGACFGWAALHLLLGLPLHLRLPRAAAGARAAAPSPVMTAAEVDDVAPSMRRQAQSDNAPITTRADAGAGARPTACIAAPATRPRPAPASWRTLWILAFAFAAMRFVATAYGAHLPGLLLALGGSLAAAVAAGALVGPAQVGGRLLEFGFLRRVHPLLSARLASLGHPLGALALLVFGMPAAVPFALLHGAGNGIVTIAKGTLPLALFGVQGYGARQAWLTMPSLALQALAPWLFGLVLERSAAAALALSIVLASASLAALLALRVRSSSPR